LGGRNVTNDLAHGLRTPVENAEKIKVAHGSAILRDKDKDTVSDVPGVGGRAAHRVPKSMLVDIIQPRIEEILTLAARELNKSEYIKMMTTGAVLTGGGSMIPGTVELAEEIFEMPVKLGIPRGIQSVSEEIHTPIHATGVGLLLYGHQYNTTLDGPLESEAHVFEKIIERMKRWFGGGTH
ncbi:MAG: cell division protein FtsA, partial [Calditrichaeota bacterium]